MAKTRENSSLGFPRLIEAQSKVMDAVSRAMAIVLEAKHRSSEQSVLVETLRSHFENIYPEPEYHSTGLDSHLVLGLHQRSRGHTGRTSEQPRLIDLVLFHMKEALEQTLESRLAKGYVLLPSPLYIAIEALTIPKESHSRAYPLLAARMVLSRRLGLWPRNAFVDQHDAANEDLVDESTIIEEFGHCRTWVDYNDIWRMKADPKKSFIGHYLASRGVLLLRVAEDGAIKFLQDGLFSLNWKEAAQTRGAEWQFRLSQKYAKLPSPSEFMNEILGIPVALRGTENVFFNGIKPSVNAGLVMQLSGGPGTGKTTFALALAAALAPIGTQTLYFSFEEAESDLVSKLRQQNQPRMSRLSYRSAKDDEWFNTFPIATTSLEAIETTIIEPLKTHIAATKSDWSQMRADGALIPPLPFLVVLDSLSALSVEDEDKSQLSTPELERRGPHEDSRWNMRRRLAAFVDICHQMRVLVILITADDPSWGDLDYLVDMVISLRVEGGDEHGRKPIRLFTLSKSRQQITRHGTHIFHLSGDAGFRLAPQLSSQMDAQQDLRQQIWDKNIFSEVFNVRSTDAGRYKYDDFLKLHWRSQLLLQGRGSSGKAGLALKIALSPRYNAQGFLLDQESPRVLVISFLYPPSYYEELQQRIVRALLKESQISSLRNFGKRTAEEYVKRMPKISVIHLTPGVLFPEDLYSKLVRSLEEGRLMGRPYSAVIIDGLHNLALQFPGAGESNYLFPIIYGTLSRSNVTTIATFTTLALESSEKGVSADRMEESAFRLRVHLPLLHTLVQGSDYVFEIFRADRLGHSNRGSDAVPTAFPRDDRATYLIKVHSAISRDPPTRLIGWRRQELEFSDPGWEFDEVQGSLPIA